MILSATTVRKPAIRRNCVQYGNEYKRRSTIATPKEHYSQTALPMKLRFLQATIYCGSNGASKTIYSGVSVPKTKHIDIRYHVSRDRQERGIVAFNDIMTKALGPDKHQHFATGIGPHLKI